MVQKKRRIVDPFKNPHDPREDRFKFDSDGAVDRDVSNEGFVSSVDPETELTVRWYDYNFQFPI